LTKTESVYSHHHHHHLHLFAQNTVDSGYVNEQDRKARCALTSVHNITSTVERNTHQSCSKYDVIKYKYKYKYKRCKCKYQYQYMKSKYKYKYKRSKYQYKYEVQSHKTS